MSYPKRSWYALTFGVVGWIFAGLLGVGLALAVPAYLALHQAQSLSAQGVEVTGRVTTLMTRARSCGRNNMDSCTDYNVGYAFEVGAVTQTGRASVAASFYRGLRQGGPVEVRYVEGDPAVSEIDIGTGTIAAGFLALLAALFAGVGALVLGLRMRRAGWIIRLRDAGTMRRAVATRHQPTNARVNGQHQYVLFWQDDAGVVGRSRYRRRDVLPAVGEAITVYADPEGKLPPVWEGDSGTR